MIDLDFHTTSNSDTLSDTDFTDDSSPIADSSINLPTVDRSSPSIGDDGLTSRIDRSHRLLSHLPPIEKQQFWEFGEGPREPLALHSIHKAFQRQVMEIPGNTAVSFQGESITYEALDRVSDALAVDLRKQGVQPGDTVPLFLERSVSMVIGILAVLKTGAAYAPQHVGVAPDTQLAYIASTVDAKVILTLEKFSNQSAACTGQPVILIDEYAKIFFEKAYAYSADTGQMRHFGDEDGFDADSVAMLLFTSGTTGTPSGVRVTHRNLCNLFLTSPGNLGIRPGTTVSQILSISFDMAAWEILGCLVNGGTLLIRGKDIASTAAQANVIIATPSVLTRVPLCDCKNIKTVAVAGEPCPRELADEWSSVCQFYNSCGPTETTIVNTMLAHSRESDVLSIGVPTPNNTVYILDDKGVPCRIGETGEMWAGGYAVTAGYLDKPELTAERYRPDPFLGGDARMFNTRDLGRWTRHGTLEHLGRTDDQVKIRGFRVELDSVSNALEAQPLCTRAAVMKLDDRTLIAFVSPMGVDVDAAKKAVGEALPYYCVPEEIHVLPDLPLTSRGKIDKRLLMDAASYHRCHVDTSIVAEDDEISESRSRRLNKHAQRSDKLIEQYKQQLVPDMPRTIAAKLTHHRFYHYWRLLALVAFVNVIFLINNVAAGDLLTVSVASASTLTNLAIINLTVAILIRQQYVVNVLFKIATSAPLSMPLGFRQLMGKVYHFGGIHVGGALFGTLWMFAAVAMMFLVAFSGTAGAKPSGMTLLAATQLVLSLMLLLIMAKPSIRQKFHNSFEVVHRFGGWFSLAMFWVVALSFVNDTHTDASLLNALVKSPVFWSILLVTFSIALPWMRLRRVPVRFERPSDHVVLANFDYGVTPFAGSSTTISRSPLTEWHSFANVPAPGQSGYRLTISRAGDWTGRLIDDLPSHVWVKGIPTAGVGNVDQLFRRVVWIATGSGIGPTLPHLLSGEVPAHLVWSTRNPRKTYGDELVDEIVNVEPNAVIWDTDEMGRPDLVQMAYAAVNNFKAEAVIVIANEKLTRLVVHNMEARGIPAYGAIWDS